MKATVFISATDPDRRVGPGRMRPGGRAAGPEATESDGSRASGGAGESCKWKGEPRRKGLGGVV